MLLRKHLILQSKEHRDTVYNYANGVEQSLFVLEGDVWKRECVLLV